MLWWRRRALLGGESERGGDGERDNVLSASGVGKSGEEKKADRSRWEDAVAIAQTPSAAAAAAAATAVAAVAEAHGVSEIQATWPRPPRRARPLRVA